ncbi:zinc finger protein 239-like [Coccinella septempunctata]|uniref:zinc finger protein 239-like n=1 Tax=Coccinella septempunctata TaxID=41139 RepID=UPI001D074FAF|nr:zinc finger protein 239-like [Coccinella septempunctata]
MENMEVPLTEGNKTAQTEKFDFIKTLCRLCSVECNSRSKSIFQRKILEMIEFCFSLHPSQTDGLPKRICSTCFESLTNSYLFKIQVEATDTLLKEKMKALVSNQDILDIALNEAEIKDIQGEMISTENSTRVLENIPSRSMYNKIGSVKLNEVSLPVEDIQNCSASLKEENFKVKVIEEDKQTPEQIIYNIDLPPLIPIKPSENAERIIINQVLPQEIPPLVPLKSICHEPLSLKDSVESSEHENNDENVKLDMSQKNYKEICESSKSLFCNICRKEFKDGKKLIGHLKGHMVPKNFACKICGKKYPSHSTFQIHMRSHTGERPFKCPVCDKGFTRWAGVVSHMQTHEDNRPFKCNFCNQSFKIVSNLERHKVLHSGVLPFCCNYCGNTFSQSANLQLHIRTYHTNERPYLCSECGKGFVSSSRLNRHMWVHSGYKPFLCKICSKAYSNSGDLRNHESGAHGDGDFEKPFTCKLCDKSFLYSCRLRKHLKTHQRPLACNQCSKTFRSGDILEQHVRSKHSEVPCSENKD